MGLSERRQAFSAEQPLLYSFQGFENDGPISSDHH
jgi:hypothetical protein